MEVRFPVIDGIDSGQTETPNQKRLKVEKLEMARKNKETQERERERDRDWFVWFAGSLTQLPIALQLIWKFNRNRQQTNRLQTTVRCHSG